MPLSENLRIRVKILSFRRESDKTRPLCWADSQAFLGRNFTKRMHTRNSVYNGTEKRIQNHYLPIHKKRPCRYRKILISLLRHGLFLYLLTVLETLLQ